MWSVGSLEDNYQISNICLLANEMSLSEGLDSLFRGGQRHHVEEIHLKHMCKLLFGGKLTATLDNGVKCIKNLDTLYFFQHWCHQD